MSLMKRQDSWSQMQLAEVRHRYSFSCMGSMSFCRDFLFTVALFCDRADRCDTAILRIYSAPEGVEEIIEVGRAPDS